MLTKSKKNKLIIFLTSSTLLISFGQASINQSSKAEELNKFQNKNDSCQIWQLSQEEGKKHLIHKDYLAAEACFREAVFQAKECKASTESYTNCLSNLANILFIQNKVEEAIPLYKKALHLLEKKYENTNKETNKIICSLAEIYGNEGQFNQAFKLYKKALNNITLNNIKNNYDLAFYTYKLGNLAYKQNLANLAKNYYQNSLEILMRSENLPSNELLNLLLADYIDLYNHDGEQNKIRNTCFQNELLQDKISYSLHERNISESFFNKAVKAQIYTNINENDKNQNNIQTSSSTNLTNNANSINNINKTQFKETTNKLNKIPADPVALENINKERIAFYERMIAIDIKTLGKNHPSVARDLSGLATLYLMQNDYVKAQLFLEQVLNIYKQYYGNEALLCKRTESLLEIISSKRKKTNSVEQTENTIRPSINLDLLKQVKIPQSAQNLDTVLALNYLGLLTYSFGDIDTALEIYAWALSDTLAVCGQSSNLFANCLLDYSRILHRKGDKNKAEALETEANKIITNNLLNKQLTALP